MELINQLLNNPIESLLLGGIDHSTVTPSTPRWDQNPDPFAS